MNKDTEPEKLYILPEEIIHILLKHLMVLKNENAYLKNSAAINSFQDGIPKSKVGVNNPSLSITENKVGANNPSLGVPENKVGTNNSSLGVTENKVGTNNLSLGVTENKIGTNNLSLGVTENKIGTNNLSFGVTENRVGVKLLIYDVMENKIGANSVNSLYSAFERGLLEALNHYIKTGDGQNTIYNYYSDFVDAIAEKNLEDAKMLEAAKNTPLEDTHTLPPHLTADVAMLQKVGMALRGHLPATAKRDFSDSVAMELIDLHNAGKATGAELNDFGGLSKAGFSKHLRKLKEYGLIKSEPPSNYVLTDISKNILLKLFGIPKNN